MNVGLHERIKRAVDQTMSRNQWLSGKGFRNNPHGEMTTASRSASMSGVQMAVVFYFDLLRLQCKLESAADFFDARRHGIVLTKG